LASKYNYNVSITHLECDDTTSVAVAERGRNQAI